MSNSNGRWIRNQKQSCGKLALRLLDDINADITTITDEDMEKWQNLIKYMKTSNRLVNMCFF